MPGQDSGLRPRLRTALVVLLLGALAGPRAPAADRVDETGEATKRGSATDLKHPLYEFAGALNNTTSTVKRATVVLCANIHPADSVDIEVVLYEYNASRSYTGAVSVDPLETATFESSQVAFYTADVFMNAGSVEQGFGQIRTSHRSVICSAQTIDPENAPPTWGFDLPLHKVPLPDDGVFADRFDAP